MQIALHLDWPFDGPPQGFALADDDTEPRPFSGRLELLAVLEELCIATPLTDDRS